MDGRRQVTLESARNLDEFVSTGVVHEESGGPKDFSRQFGVFKKGDRVRLARRDGGLGAERPRPALTAVGSHPAAPVPPSAPLVGTRRRCLSGHHRAAAGRSVAATEELKSELGVLPLSSHSEWGRRVAGATSEAVVTV